MTTYPLDTLTVTVDDTGISAPAYSDIYQSLIASFQGIYGSDIYVAEDSQDGQWLAFLAKLINSANQAAITVFNAFSPTNAQGTHLSSLVKINGLTRNTSGYSTATGTVAGTVGTEITDGVVSDGTYSWDLPETVIIGSTGEETVTVTCETEGEIAAAIGEIDEISTPTRGWTSFTNTTAATVGDAVETDATLRTRQSESTANPSQSTDESLQGGILNVSGVTDCFVYQNDTNETNDLGHPAHSITCVVVGGDSADIAEQIRVRKGEGVYPNGDIEETTTDSRGVTETERYYAGAEVEVDATITITAGTGYVSTTGDEVQSAVEDYLTGLGIAAGNTSGAGTIYYGKIWSIAQLMDNDDELYKTFTVTEVTMARDSGTQSVQNLAFDFNEIPTVGTITVTVS